MSGESGSGLTGILSNIGSYIGPAFEKIFDWGPKILSALSGPVDKLKESISGAGAMLGEYKDKIKTMAASWLPSWATGMFNSVIDGLHDKTTKNAEQFSKQLKGMFNKLVASHPGAADILSLVTGADLSGDTDNTEKTPEQKHKEHLEKIGNLKQKFDGLADKPAGLDKKIQAWEEQLKTSDTATLTDEQLTDFEKTSKLDVFNKASAPNNSDAEKTSQNNTNAPKPS